jgi:hypothetical protein
VCKVEYLGMTAVNGIEKRTKQPTEWDQTLTALNTFFYDDTASVICKLPYEMLIDVYVH